MYDKSRFCAEHVEHAGIMAVNCRDHNNYSVPRGGGTRVEHGGTLETGFWPLSAPKRNKALDLDGFLKKGRTVERESKR